MISRWTAALTALTMMLLALASCGGGDIDRTKAQVRLVNASGGYAALDLRAHDTLRQGSVAYAASSSYVEIAPDDNDMVIANAGSTTPLVSFTPSISKDSWYSVIAYGNAGALQQQTINENVDKPDSGKVLLRVLNAAADAGTLDVYLTGSGEALATSVPLFGAVTYGTLGSATTVNAGSYEVRVTAAGSKTDLRFDLPTLSLTSQQIATLVLTPGSGGLLVNALLVVQQSGITRLDGTQARVRVVAGVADGGSVSANVGGTPLTASLGSPAFNLYTLVPAGSAQAVVVAVNGTALQAGTFTPVAGGDYTLLVSGPLAAPQVNWITDDNHPPTDTTQAKLRLVNGVIGLVPKLSMTADFLSVADSVAAGSSSPYVLVNATTTGLLTVTAAGATAPVYSVSGLTLSAGAIYSVFAVGSPAAPVAILRRDR